MPLIQFNIQRPFAIPLPPQLRYLSPFGWIFNTTCSLTVSASHVILASLPRYVPILFLVRCCTYDTECSLVVTHPGNNLAQTCLNFCDQIVTDVSMVGSRKSVVSEQSLEMNVWFDPIEIQRIIFKIAVSSEKKSRICVIFQLQNHRFNKNLQTELR